MLTQPATQADIVTRLNLLPSPRSPWRVSAVAVLPDDRLQAQFLDGTEGIVDLAALVHSPNAGVFASLSDPQRFVEVCGNGRRQLAGWGRPGTGRHVCRDERHMGEKLTHA